MDSKTREYELMQSVLEIAKYDKGKAMQVLGGLRTTALNNGDFLFVKKIDGWINLI